MKYLHFSNTDRHSSMSSDPIMVCFCNTTTNLPDCSDRTHHIQTYPGLEINTSIATVGYYGGTSPGVVLVSAQHATLVRYYGQNETTNCFQLHILLQNTSSTTALVDIRVKNVVQGLSVSIGVDILECPIGFTEISGQCYCDHFLNASNVQCKLSATHFKFLRSGTVAYNNNTQCITGTTIVLLTTAIDPMPHLTSWHQIVSVWPIEQVYSVDNASLTLVSCWDPTAVVLAPTGIYSCCQCLPSLA